MDDPELAYAPLRVACRGDAHDDEPGADPGRFRPGGLCAVEKGVRLTRYGGDCYAYCALAAGFVDLVIETNLKPHDIVALAPIIEGAGGVVPTWEGENAAKGGRIIAAGDRALYAEARRLLLQG
jgi:fructose-1,6-bisphosphatase/inositol monophosphatase family enzyme